MNTFKLLACLFVFAGATLAEDKPKLGEGFPFKLADVTKTLGDPKEQTENGLDYGEGVSILALKQDTVVVIIDSNSPRSPSAKLAIKFFGSKLFSKAESAALIDYLENPNTSKIVSGEAGKYDISVLSSVSRTVFDGAKMTFYLKHKPK